MNQSTYSPKKGDIKPIWYLIDAAGITVGKLSVQIADILRGKRKPIFARHTDTGDFIVVINAEKLKFTGKKLDQKVYYHHTGYLGGMKMVTASTLLKTKPEFILKHAVKGMLPKNKLGRKQIKKLKIYTGSSHPHLAQSPQTLQVTN